MDEEGKRDIGMSGNNSEDGGDGSVVCLKAPLGCIWEDEHVEKLPNNGGWKCLWCGGIHKPAHAKRAKAHVLKVDDYKGISPCPAVIPEAE